MSVKDLIHEYEVEEERLKEQLQQMGNVVAEQGVWITLLMVEFDQDEFTIDMKGRTRAEEYTLSAAPKPGATILSIAKKDSGG